MKKRCIVILVVIIAILFLIPAAGAQETCTPNHHRGCVGRNVWWYDSCDAPTSVAQYCGWNQDCVDGSCVQRCGNGRCDSDENCASCQTDCRCASSERCFLGRCETYCGNGQCDGSENCGNCFQDCRCSEHERCSYNRCETYCGNGQCDSNENCGSCFQDCGCGKSEECAPGTARADQRGCASLCGNGKRDSGEDCMSCALDAGCTPGTYCLNGQCVDCIRDEHCATRDTPTGQFICAPDFRSTLEKVVRKAGLCRGNKCTGEDVETTKQGKQCGDKLCQDGHCGCNEGYEVCLATGKCEKTGVLEDGSNCGCYFQCRSNYCSKSGKCMKAVNTILSSHKSIIKAGEETIVTISADNSMDVDIPTKLTLNIDTGASMSGVIGGADCTGNQCTGGQIIVPAKHRTSVEVNIQAQSAGKLKLTATITPVIEGVDYPKTEEIFITVFDPRDGKCTDGETSSNACVDCGCPPDTRLYTFECEKKTNTCDRDIGWWMYLIIGIVVLVVVLIYFGATKGKALYARLADERESRQKEREKEEREEKAKEQAGRKKVVKALYKMKINPDNPPTVHEIIKRLHKLDADDDIIEEEYEQMLRRMEERPRRKKAMNEPAYEKTGTRKTPKFCTKCGARLKSGVKFCTKCGSTVKK